MAGTKKRLDIKKNITPYLLVGPAMIALIIFVVYPVFYMIRLGFYSWNLVSPKMKFVGIDNYISFFTSSDVLNLLKNTSVYTLFFVIGTLAVALLLALYLNDNTKLSRFGQISIFVPHVISLVSISLLWMWLLEPEYGLLNLLLSYFRIPPVKWLANRKTALPSLIMVSIWKSTGYYALVITAALNNIDKSIIEAARIDNANRFRIFYKITIPLISPTLFFLLIITTISSFKVFDIIQIMTRGGPVESTNMLVYYIYDNAFRFMKIGYASASGVVLLVILGLLTIIYFRVLSDRVHYQ